MVLAANSYPGLLCQSAQTAWHRSWLRPFPRLPGPLVSTADTFEKLLRHWIDLKAHEGQPKIPRGTRFCASGRHGLKRAQSSVWIGRKAALSIRDIDFWQG